MASAISNGSLTHVRYGHASRPREIDVVCAGCGGCAHASQPTEQRHAIVVSDLSEAWSIPNWRTSCPSCPYRASGLAYEALPELFWRFTVRDAEVWAWNRDHLAFLAAFLGEEDVAGHPYSWFAAYVPGVWKREGEVIARKIRDRLNVG